MNTNLLQAACLIQAKKNSAQYSILNLSIYGMFKDKFFLVFQVKWVDCQSAFSQLLVLQVHASFISSLSLDRCWTTEASPPTTPSPHTTRAQSRGRLSSLQRPGHCTSLPSSQWRWVVQMLCCIAMLLKAVKCGSDWEDTVLERDNFLRRGTNVMCCIALLFKVILMLIGRTQC